MGLLFWKKRPSQATNVIDSEKQISAESHHHEKPSPASRGVPIRPDVNPAYSAYSTPADPTWADSLTPKYLPPAALEAKLKEEGITDPEEIARRKAKEARKKTEQDEQERMDFLQMM
ncbi:hypothetical protein QBC38DRAFT_455517 [Podospora fimiseda]|uniref:Uncharacterized protein n=1 Tax=Podospora fimiseda TaxID=252190 RepID=A0AAN7BPJ6_9PEZI|nr:hypothetical protein QBC38DRAFT_455517 [Podospora fimiseda]